MAAVLFEADRCVENLKILCANWLATLAVPGHATWAAVIRVYLKLTWWPALMSLPSNDVWHYSVELVRYQGIYMSLAHLLPCLVCTLFT